LGISNWNYDVEESQFSDIIPEDKKVLFKAINSNNFAVLTKHTKDEKSLLILYIIHAENGKVIQKQYEKNVDFNLPINLLYDENSVFVTYYNPESLFYEIWVTELYRSNFESSFTEMLHKHFFENSLNKDADDVYYFQQPEYVVFPQKYLFPLGIKKIEAVKTFRGVTKRNLLIITPNNQLYSMDRALLSTRRIEGTPLENQDHSFGSAELPPYQPILPQIPLFVASYNYQLVGLKDIVVSPTTFESTSLVLTYGHDLYFTRVSPEKGYDMLNEDFNYIYLIVTVVTILAATYVMKRMAKGSKIYRIFSGI